MVLGMSLSTYTLIHVIISLAGIGSGFIVMYGLLNSKRLDGWTAIFLTTTVLTSVTGFFFPFEGLKPSYILAVISLVVLAIAIWARYSRRLEGGARRTYILTAALALYLNCFVGVIQAFAKILPCMPWPQPRRNRLSWWRNWWCSRYLSGSRFLQADVFISNRLCFAERRIQGADTRRNPM